MLKSKVNINTEKYWDEHYSGERRGHPHRVVFTKHKVLYDKIVDTIFAYPHNAILDLGAGLGSVPYLMKRREFDFKNRLYLAVDFSEIGIRKAQEVIPEINIYRSRIDIPLALPSQYKQFDIIVCCEVLEHLTNYVEGLKNIYKYLKPEGISIVSIPHGRIMVKEHYHPLISQDEIVMQHEAVNLFPFAVIIVSRWQIILSKKAESKDVVQKKANKAVVTDLRLPIPNKQLGKNLC